MKKQIIDSLESCNALLKNNVFFANGKNFKVSHLYATSANSRWPHENIWGIYLAKPQFAWMALWMAITSRSKLKKRQIKYFPPGIKNGDFIGKVGIFNPRKFDLGDILCEEAYLYFFNPDILKELFLLDISNINNQQDKITTLKNAGFKEKFIVRRGKEYRAYAPSFAEPMIVDIDDWQIALVNIEKVTPVLEVVVSEKLIRDLSVRIEWLREEVGENYIS